MTEYAWYDNGKGRQVYRPVIKESTAERSNFPSPRLNLDTIDATLSHADGKEYTSKAALRATYKAENNPQGYDYIELGTDPVPAYQKPKRDPKKILETIERAEADVAAGRPAQVETLGSNETLNVVGVV